VGSTLPLKLVDRIEEVEVMLKRGLVLVMSLALVSPAFAGATVDLVATDLGNTPCNGIDGCAFTPVAGPFNGGETILVHVMVTPTQTIRLRGAQVDYRASSPELTLGMDANTVNQPLDGVPNFWFDYSPITIAGILPQGTYPADGINPVSAQPSTGAYTDFSNLLSGDPAVPFPPAMSYSASSDTGNMLQFDGGVATRLGGIVVTLPSEPGEYTVDLLNPPAGEEPSVNNGMVLDFGFGIDPGDDVTKWASAPQDGGPDLLIRYGQGGPLTLTVIPEPATLVLLGLGGIAALRRRRS
jgi:hypothetical protein